MTPKNAILNAFYYMYMYLYYIRQNQVNNSTANHNKPQSKTSDILPTFNNKKRHFPTAYRQKTTLQNKHNSHILKNVNKPKTHKKATSKKGGVFESYHIKLLIKVTQKVTFESYLPKLPKNTKIRNWSL